MGSGKSPDHTLQRCRLGDEWTLSRKLSDPFESGAETSVEPLQFPSKKLVDFTVIHMVICDQLNGAYIRMVHPFATLIILTFTYQLLFSFDDVISRLT